MDVAKGIESTLVMLNHKLKHGITIVRNYDASLPRISSYGSELNQVWTNLIDNAADAMKGQGELRIRTMREGDDVLVEFVDNGPGIPPEIQTKIFDPFFTTKPMGEGTGLGLDTVYRIVRKHRGNVSVVSRHGVHVLSGEATDQEHEDLGRRSRRAALRVQGKRRHVPHY